MGCVALLAASLAIPGPGGLDPLGLDLARGYSPASPPSPPTVQGSTSVDFSALSGTSSPSLSVAPGDAVVVIVASHYARTVASVHDASGDSYQDLTTVSSGSSSTLSVWEADDAVPSTGLTVTVALSKSAPTVLSVAVVSGTATESVDAVGASVTAANSPTVTASVTTVASEDLVLMAVSSTGTPSISPTTTGAELITAGHENAGNVHQTGGLLSEGVGVPGMYSLSAKLTTSESWAAVAIALTPGSSIPPPPSTCSADLSSFLGEFCQHIQHVVFIVMENHAYDNLFPTYCLSASPVCNGTADGMPTGTCEFEVGYTGTGYPAGSCPKGEINSWNYGPKNLTTINPPHSEASSVRSICGTTASVSCLANTPAMDGFWEAEGKEYTPFGHYNATTVPIDWDIAQQFGLGDAVFSSDPSYSLPNHWFIVAGQAPKQSESYLETSSQKHTYLKEAGQTPTIEDLLNGTPDASWKYYDWSLASYKTAISGAQSNAYGAGSAYSYWNPLAAKAESYTNWYVDHFVNRTPTLFNDLAEAPGPGEGLPNISWVIPDAAYSDHPPANLSQGQSFVANVLDSIEESRYWNSTAVFLTWDDYGGFYDQAGPPKLTGLNPLGLSFRVPFLAISPYTPQGSISHQLLYFDSVLHLMEERWGMGCVDPSLPTQDCQAPLPSSFFDFTNLTSPRAPCLFPIEASEAEYPMGCLSAASVGPLDTASWTGSDAGLSADDAD